MMMSQFLFRPDAVILANGVFPTHAIPLGVLRSAPMWFVATDPLPIGPMLML